MTYLYTRKGCPACEQARQLLRATQVTWREVVVDNPLLELGIQVLNGGEVRVPLVVRPQDAILALGPDGQLHPVYDLRHPITVDVA